MTFDCKKMHSKCKAKCCGIVPLKKDLLEKYKEKMVRMPLEIKELFDCVVPITEDAYCVFLNEDLSCNIYEDRPSVCRKFGDESHPLLCCPVLDKNGKERSEKQQQEIKTNVNSAREKLRIFAE